MDMVNALEHAKDLADTARAIAGLDLVITVDTAIAHLAGSLGKEVWLLCYSGPDWRWGIGTEETRWYPTMRLFRQKVGEGWAPVILRVLDALKARLGVQPEVAVA
jgi:ADP-heptose:LPS heptosyltransferase